MVRLVYERLYYHNNITLQYTSTYDDPLGPTFFMRPLKWEENWGVVYGFTVNHEWEGYLCTGVERYLVSTLLSGTLGTPSYCDKCGAKFSISNYLDYKMAASYTLGKHIWYMGLQSGQKGLHTLAHMQYPTNPQRLSCAGSEGISEIKSKG